MSTRVRIKRTRFAAYYEGRKIAKARMLEGLMDMRRARRFLGEKEFLIRRLDSGKAKVIYQGSSGFFERKGQSLVEKVRTSAPASIDAFAKRG